MNDRIFSLTPTLKKINITINEIMPYPPSSWCRATSDVPRKQRCDGGTTTLDHTVRIIIGAKGELHHAHCIPHRSNKRLLNLLDLTLTNICTLFLKGLSSFRFSRPIEGTSHILSGLFKSHPWFVQIFNF